MFQLWGHEKNTLIAGSVRRADSPISRFFGLMGKPGLQEQEGLWISPCNSIHSCFMRFEFDAVFLDRSLKVIHLIERMKPWRVSPLFIPAHSVVELPAGSIARHGVRVGDALLMKKL